MGKWLDIRALANEAVLPREEKATLTLLGAPYYLTPTVHFVAAITKHGKTNFAANLVRHALVTKEGAVVAGLNEEPPLHFLARVACMDTDLSFADWLRGLLTEEQRATLAKSLELIVPRIHIVNEEVSDLGCLEEVESYLRESAQSTKVSLAIFDYMQNLNRSKDSPQSTPYELYKLFGMRVKDIGKKSNCPLVVFGQLKDNKSQEQGFKSRVEGDSWFVNNVASGLELCADKLNKRSCITVQVDRHQNSTHMEFWYSHLPSGKLVPAKSPQQLEEEPAIP